MTTTKITALGLVIFAVSGLRAQSSPSDADLDRASGSRLVAIRALSGGPITRVPIEVYVARVLAGEGEPGAPEATQQALAIAIRTFAIFNAGRHQRDGYDLCDTTHCQVLRTATADSRRAALATAGRILTYKGTPAEIFYSASCGGRSESASDVWPNSNLPYLRSVVDDVHDDDEPWTLELTLDEAQRMLRRNGFDGSLKNVQVDDRNESGRASRLKLSGMRPEAITGEQLRAALGTMQLKSTAFAVSKHGRTLRFTGRGFGHGVGMCVIGAGRRARRGESVDQILAKYYPGVTVTGLADVPAPPVMVAAAPAPVARAASPRGITVRAPKGSPVTAAEIERLAGRAEETLSKTLGLSAVPVTVELHETIDSFRAATDSPWWVSASVSGSTIDLAPVAVLAQRGGVETVLRTAVAELLLKAPLENRPAWVQVGAARYFARLSADGAAVPSRATDTRSRVKCPADAELTFAVSAAAQREAESRAEACFARTYARTKDWRSVR